MQGFVMFEGDIFNVEEIASVLLTSDPKDNDHEGTVRVTTLVSAGSVAFSYYFRNHKAAKEAVLELFQQLPKAVLN